MSSGSRVASQLCIIVLTALMMSRSAFAQPASPLTSGDGAATKVSQIKTGVSNTGGKFTDFANAIGVLLTNVTAAVYTAQSFQEKNDLADLSDQLGNLKIANRALRRSIDTFNLQPSDAAWTIVLSKAQSAFGKTYALENDVEASHLAFFEASSTLRVNLLDALGAKAASQSALSFNRPKNENDLAILRSLPRLIEDANVAIDKTQGALKEYLKRRFPVEAFGA